MNLQETRVLVTGATGTIGSRIAARLMAEGARVRALVRTAGGVDAGPGVEEVQGDLTDAVSVEEAMDGVQVVVHAAAFVEHSAAPTDWTTARAVNVEGSRHVAEAALAAGVRRLVHFSSLAAYDVRGRAVVDENTPTWTEVSDPYAQTKADAERVVRDAAARGLGITILRPGAVLGVHPRSVWGPLMVEWIREGNSMGYHPQDQISWTHVENLAEMTVLVLRSPAAEGEAYTAIDGVFRMDRFMGPIAAWLGVDYPAVPDRDPSGRRYPPDKIERLGYCTRVTFDEAMAELKRFVTTGR